MPFKAFCDDWMESAKVILKPRTWASYQSALKNWITPAFGERSLSEIRKADVVDFLYGILKNRDISRKFVKNVHIFLHRLFEAAIERDLLAANPTHKIKLPEASPVFGASAAVDRVVPTPAEVVKTFEKLTPTYQALLATSARTGARRGELLGLYWEDIDWTRGMYCSLLQESGASLKFAQERLGHADASTTANIHTHVINDQGHEFAEKVEAAFPFPCVSLMLTELGMSDARPEAVN